MPLPKKLTWEMSQTTWASQLDPIINFAPIKGNLLTGISISAGVNVINHKLQRKQQGWIITDQDASSLLYRSADFNDLTLELTASAPCTLNLWVY